MKKSLTLIGLFLIAVILMTACRSQPSKPKMTFETIGIKGTTVFVTLVSPSPDEVSAEDLANRLRKDWQNQRFSGINLGHVSVMVFDNKDAPQRWLQIWDRLASMSDQEWSKEQAQIFPHFIAQYFKNTTTGFHQVEFYSRDAENRIMQTIKF